MSASGPPTAAAPQPLGDDEIHVWLCEIAAADAAARRRAAQHFLRRTLAAYRGCGIDEVVLELGAHGKPALADGVLAFNLSHSGSHAVLALARGIEVGVDIEVPTRPRPLVALARRYFCAAEADTIAAAGDGDREHRFLRLWTAKEAVLKALGRGLAFGLDRLEFDMNSAPPVLRWIAPDGGKTADWRVRALPVVPPAIGHLAWHGEVRRVCFFRKVITCPSTPQQCH
jgi:4'-phosphopantetheinyl transferase